MLLVTQKFFSLKNLCYNCNQKIEETAIIYIDSVVDQNFLTELMLEKDYTGRDSLRMFVELELLVLI